MKTFSRLLAAVLACFLLSWIALPLAHVWGDPLPDIDQQAIDGNWVQWKPNSQQCASPTGTTSGGNLTSGSKVYILGDSITVRTAPDYNKDFQAKGITTTISAVSGRSWTQPGNPGVGTTGTQGTGKEAVAKDSDSIKAANGIIIALGTNGYINGNPIDEIYNTIRNVNSSAPIWWVNVAAVNPYTPGVADFNSKLEAASNGKFTVIHWDKAVDPTGDGTHDPSGILEDGTHPVIGPKGTGALASLVVTSVTGQATVGNTTPASTTSTGGCACPAGGSIGDFNFDGKDNQENAYKFFVSKGLTPYQAAGVVGNLMRESGLNPTIVNSSSGAYGIGQWLPGSRLDNMRAWVADPQRNTSQYKDPATFQAQIQFLVYESQGRDSRTYPGTKEWDGLKLQTNLHDAVVYWEHNFERADDPPSGIAQRESFAQDTLTKYGSGAPTSGGGSSSSSCPAANLDLTNLTFNYVDTARNRKLTTTAWIPTSGGPYPVILFAHGFQKGPDAYARYIKAIASKGYVVVAPSFPNADEHGILPLDRNSSLPQQPADLQFVLGQVLQEPQLKDKIKTDAVGLVGHSDGAIDALLDGYGPNKDNRLKVVVAVSADDISSQLSSGPPLLQMHGDKDTIASHDGDLNNFHKISANPKFFYTLLGADHFNVVATGTDDTGALDALTVAMLDQILNNKTDAVKNAASPYTDKVKAEQ